MSTDNDRPDAGSAGTHENVEKTVPDASLTGLAQADPTETSGKSNPELEQTVLSALSGEQNAVSRPAPAAVQAPPAKPLAFRPVPAIAPIKPAVQAPPVRFRPAPAAAPAQPAQSTSAEGTQPGRQVISDAPTGTPMAPPARSFKPAPATPPPVPQNAQHGPPAAKDVIMDPAASAVHALPAPAPATPPPIPPAAKDVLPAPPARFRPAPAAAPAQPVKDAPANPLGPAPQQRQVISDAPAGMAMRPPARSFVPARANQNDEDDGDDLSAHAFDNPDDYVDPPPRRARRPQPAPAQGNRQAQQTQEPVGVITPARANQIAVRVADAVRNAGSSGSRSAIRTAGYAKQELNDAARRGEIDQTLASRLCAYIDQTIACLPKEESTDRQGRRGDRTERSTRRGARGPDTSRRGGRGTKRY